MLDHVGGAGRPEPSASCVKEGATHLSAVPSWGRGRLEAMVNEHKRKFGERLFLLMGACDLDKKDIARFVGLTTTVQVDNYLKGEQGPTFEGMAKLRILFGIKTGEVDGSEPWPTSLDPITVRERLNALG